MYSYFIGHTKKQDKIFFSTIIDYIIFIMFLLYSLVDCLTGMSKVIGIPSIGVPYKLLLILLMILSTKSNKIIVYTYFFSVIFLSAFFYSIFRILTFIFTKFNNVISYKVLLVWHKI